MTGDRRADREDDDERAVEAADELLAGQGVGSAAAQEGAPGEAAQALPGVEGDSGSMLR